MEITDNSFWKPLSGPVKDWPLALCSPRTVKPERDFEPCDLVYPDYVVENRQVYHSTDYDWFYVSDQRPHEAWVFLQSDTETETKPGKHRSYFSLEVSDLFMSCGNFARRSYAYLLPPCWCRFTNPA